MVSHLLFRELSLTKGGSNTYLGEVASYKEWEVDCNLLDHSEQRALLCLLSEGSLLKLEFTSWLDWPLSLQNLPVSTFSTEIAAIPGVLHAYWVQSYSYPCLAKIFFSY